MWFLASCLQDANVTSFWLEKTIATTTLVLRLHTSKEECETRKGKQKRQIHNFSHRSQKCFPAEVLKCWSASSRKKYNYWKLNKIMQLFTKSKQYCFTGAQIWFQFDQQPFCWSHDNAVKTRIKDFRIGWTGSYI